MGGRTSLVVRQAIETDIDEGRLMPGDVLDEQGLADRFEVSRTPAREALLHLAAIGVVRLVPRRGAVVQDLPPGLAAGMVEVLTALEAEAAGLAARRMTAAEREAMAALHAAARPAVKRLDSAAYLAANAAFHGALYAGARNAFLAEQLRLTRRRMGSYHRSSLGQPARIRASWDEHAALLEAVRTGDEDGARAAMRAHILSGGRVFADLMAGER